MPKELRTLLFAAAAILAGLAVYQAAGLFFFSAPPSAPPEPPLPAVSAPPAPPKPPAKAGAPRAYTNEELNARMQDETEKEGMSPLGPGEAARDSSRLLGEARGAPGTRERAEGMIQQLSAMRHALESEKPKPVPLEGNKPSLLSGPSDEGGPAGESASWSGYESGGLTGNRIIADQKTWRTVWARLSQKPAPKVDFESRRVAAVFLGARAVGGGSVEILGAEETAAETIVRYRERAPLPSVAPPEGPASPYAMREIPRRGLPVRFEPVP